MNKYHSSRDTKEEDELDNDEDDCLVNIIEEEDTVIEV
jgi:hypothetical protein